MGDILSCVLCVTFVLSVTQFGIICDLLLNRCAAIWNLFVYLLSLCCEEGCLSFCHQHGFKKKNLLFVVPKDHAPGCVVLKTVIHLSIIVSIYLHFSE